MSPMTFLLGLLIGNIIYFLKSFKGCCSFVASGTENVFLGSYRSRLTDSDGMSRKKAPGLNGSRMENGANSQGAAQSLHWIHCGPRGDAESEGGPLPVGSLVITETGVRTGKGVF